MKIGKKGKVGLAVVVLVLLVVFLFFGTLINFVTDYMWFKDLGYTDVFFKKLFTQLKIGIPSFIVVSLLAFLYLKVLKRDYCKKIEIQSYEVSDKHIARISAAVSLIFGGIMTLSIVKTLWQEILYYMNSTAFNVADPIFNRDISFYVFKLVLVSRVNEIVMGLVVAFVLLTALFYFYLVSVRRPVMFEEWVSPGAESTDGDGQQQAGPNNFFGFNFGPRVGGQPKPGKHLDRDNIHNLINIASRQLTILGVIFFLMVSTSFFIRQFQLMYSDTGTVYGAGFTDINVSLWGYRILMALGVLAAIMVIVGMTRKKYKQILIVPVLMILVSVASSGIGSAVQSLIVSPDEINKEYKYMENNIAYTQQAYGLNNITEKDFAATNDLTAEDILNNMGTISNIRINDFRPAEQFYNQTQSIRTYYRFNDVDVDRYMVNGEYTQTFLSAREIDETKIGDAQWLTKHIKYTHGYGITLSRVDKVTASGQPDMLIDSIPPVSEVEEIQIKRPEIYFGELTDNYIITNTSEPEFDYPSGTSNTYTNYEGSTGIKLNLFNRILYAIKEQNIKILVSTNINNESKIIYERNILDRVMKLAPFLSYDSDPYIVVSDDGKLYWMLDAYTMTSLYPYSRPYNAEVSRTNYIRNSVKVVVDAYNGTVDFYLVEPDEPIAATLNNIYPTLFKDFSEMPSDLKKHVRYPNLLFEIQAKVYQRYHMSDVNVFYQNEDMWQISSEIYGTEEVEMEPSYYIMKLPGEDSVEFISSIPYTPKDKKNMTGLLVARNDGEHYGELIIFRLPKDRIIYGPLQIESQVDQDTNISKEFTLWNSAGSNYSRGNMFVIPIEDSLIYVEPVYIEAANESSLPEVKRVIVAYGDKIAYEATLAEALDKLFGTGTDFIANYYGGVVTTPPEDGESSSGTEGETATTVDELIVAANDAYKKATDAQQSGDWAAYGKYLDELGEYLTLLAGADGSTSGLPLNTSAADDDLMQEATGLRTIDNSNIDADVSLEQNNNSDDLNSGQTSNGDSE